jgi:alkylresorcinol/alkylpyrone synthase
MPKINSVGRALPPYKMMQDDVREFASIHFGRADSGLERLLDVFKNAQINQRYFSVPVEWYRTPHTFVEKNEEYVRSCDRLGAAAARECLDAAGVTTAQVDYVIFVSTTGIATPSIDARLINLLGLRSNIRRTPMWGLGCAGGAAGLSHAYHYLVGHPKERVLIVAIELCGLTFQQNDFSRSNFVATALFGEGAAAVLMAGDEVEGTGLAVLDTRSTFWPDSLDVMGWNVMNTGLQVVFSQSIPKIVKGRARASLEEFLGDHSLSLSDITYFMLHPGGMKVIEAYEDALGLATDKLELCRQALRDYGNMSSVSVLFVLAAHLKQFSFGSGKFGIISALGPGFCSESLLVQF